MSKQKDFVVKGAPKLFFQEDNVDRLFAMVIALGAEIAAMSEKLDTVVRLLEDRQVFTRAAVAGFQPDEVGRLERDAALKALVETLLASFQEAAASLAERAAARR